MKTLVYHSGALGDFITILPVLEIWKRYSQSHVVLIGKPEYAILAKVSGYIDEIIDINSREGLDYFRESEPQKIRELLKVYSDVILFTSDKSPIYINCKKYFSGRIINQNPFPSEKVHIIDYHYELIKNLILVTEVLIPRIVLNSDTSLQYSKTVAIHPGSGSKRKNWPIKNYYHLAEKIRSRGYAVLWITGPAEQSELFPSQDKVCKEVSLTELSLIIKKCLLFIGNDSGITHLAAAVGCRVVAIFGSSDPLVWSPRGSNKVSIIYKKTNCSPCHPSKSLETPKCNNKCFAQIPSETVFAAIEEILL